ncbi:MAG: M24 family metallopeptidase [Gammaproteobacteria bacterium]|jgi:Xaa-Pro aminopeptidase|nr:M24 family metallopeptidase [Gammaproteobacteria bacterium]MBT4462214.1 M24 family metallopeptidase [Gammaproteobacteria bacterium]MBT4654460.1 M24 family metallopeptidase [Gammaproteobacteria bacterium]MBT5116872.1 M24 family metallopeptidase [Gammaproteobacteria bacterium]MBT5761958.1 M24 family metallopeptidase [Gammaproteobacteria bacterium]
MIKNIMYKKRRKKLFDLMKNNSMVLIEAAQEKYRNNDSTFRYRQCSNFYYLTGYDKPSGLLIILKEDKTLTTHFFTKKPNIHDEIWTGKLATSSKVKKLYGFDKCDYLCDFEKHLKLYLENNKTIYHDWDENSINKLIYNKSLSKLEKKYRSGAELPSEFFSLKKILHKLRLIKDKEEIGLIRAAGKISAQAHIEMIKKCKPGLTERELEAVLLYNFNTNNATEAYTSIVASGKNACILHYIDNSSTLKNGQLLLTDAACEYKNYASDITRTIPINGKFTKEQKLIYNLVLDAQEKAIEACIVGNTLQDIHTIAVKVICRGLIKIGLISKPYKEAMKDQLYKKYYMHNTGHWLGLDVHDPSEYKEDKKPVKLKPGMIFTVEPGLYIRADNSISKKFHDIGIRIEDDILVTKNGPEVLTSKVPKSSDEIENLMRYNND